MKHYKTLHNGYVREPENPVLLIGTERFDIENSVHKVLELLDKKNVISLNES